MKSGAQWEIGKDTGLGTSAMLLTGTHERALDDKNRLALPKRVREQLGTVSQLFVSPGPDQCLWIYDPDNMERLANKLDQVSATDGEARVFRRLFFAQMETVDLDKTGRMLIPDRLVTLAGMTKDVILIGVRDHLELWAATRWKNFLEQNAPRFDAFAEGAFAKG